MFEWAMALIGIALMLFIIELFVPSGGLIGFFASMCLVGAIVCLFGVSTTAGLIGTIVSLIVLPFMFIFALRVWPHTPIGRILIHKDQQASNATPPDIDPTHGTDTQALVGATGVAITDLHPVGICKINEQRLECIAHGGVVDRGAGIRVTSVNGREINVVRA